MPDLDRNPNAGHATDSRHVLVVLAANLAPLGPGLTGMALCDELARHHFVVHRAASVEELDTATRDWPIGSLIVDLRVQGAMLDAVVAFIRGSTVTIPCLILDSGTPAAEPRRISRLEEYVRVDESWTAESVVLYFRSLVLRCHPRGAMSGPDEAECALDRTHELIVVFSAKGGSGSTTIACNLAVGLADRGKEVVLIDGDLDFGDVDLALDLAARHEHRRRGLHTVVETFDIPAGELDDRSAQLLAEFDDALLDQLLYRHSSGVHVLLAPPRPELAEHIHPAVVRRAVELCFRRFRYTIIDSRSAYTETEIQLMDLATKIVLVLKPEITSVRNTCLFLNYAERFGWRGKLLPVLNRADSTSFTGISKADIERIVGHSAIDVLSSSLVPRSVNEGRPVITAYAESRVSASLRAMVRVVTAEAPPSAEPKRGPRLHLPWRTGARRSLQAASL